MNCGTPRLLSYTVDTAWFVFFPSRAGAIAQCRDALLRRSFVQVTNNARSNLFLRALSNVLENSSLRLCGNSSCLDLAYAMVFRLGWQTAIVLVLLLIAAPNLLFLLLRSMLER